MTTGTFGFMSGGGFWGSSYTGNAEDWVTGHKHELTETGTPLSITMLVRESPPFNPKIKFAIYDDTGTGGNPGALLAYTDEWTLPDDYNDWKTLNVAWLKNNLSPGYYYLTHFSDEGFRYWYSASGGTVRRKQAVYNGFPDPFHTSPFSSTYRPLIYCTYEIIPPTVVGGSEHYYYFKKKEEREEDEEEEANQKDSPLDKIRFWEQSKKAFYGSIHYELIKEVADKEIKAIIEKAKLL